MMIRSVLPSVLRGRIAPSSSSRRSFSSFSSSNEVTSLLASTSADSGCTAPSWLQSLRSRIIIQNKRISPSASSSFSTAAKVSEQEAEPAVSVPAAVNNNNNKFDRPPTYTRPQLITTPDGKQIAIFRQAPPGKNRKLKPHIVARRLRQMRTYEGKERSIRHSPWRLNLVCQFAAGLPLQEALLQLDFNNKRMAPLVRKVLKRTSNLADIRHGLQMSQLEVAECFATRATPLKRIKIMGRGRHGKMQHRHAHMRVVLREIDFPLRIYQARSMNQKRHWFQLQQQAEHDYAHAKAKREEKERLERLAAENAAAAAAAEKKKK